MISNQAGLGLGDKVHTEEINEYPDDLKQEFLHLSLWVKALARHYGRSVAIRVIDPQSLLGMWKALRHRIRRYPVFILDGEEQFNGWEAEEQLHAQLRARIAARGLPAPDGDFSLIPQPSFQPEHG